MAYKFVSSLLSFSLLGITFANIDFPSRNPTDLSGLLKFKDAIQVDTSGRLEKWVGKDCCKWEGISCESTTGRVTEINLPGLISKGGFIIQTTMKGTLTPSITLLSSLEILNLGGLFFLSGPIPDSISSLKNLVTLDLHDNHLSGSIPQEIGALQSLEQLDLSNNSLTGQIPLSLTNLKAITTVYLNTNCLKREIPFPVKLGDMPSLRFLRLQNNQLTGTIPSAFGYLTSLERLSLANNKLEGPVPSGLGNLSNLTELYLNDNRFSGVIPESIGKLSKLILLTVSHNLIRDPLPESMSSLQNLQSLDVSFNLINLHSIPKWLVGLPSISRIFLAGCRILGEIPKIMQTTPSPLLELDLSANNLAGTIPAWIGTLTKLYSLNLSRNSLVSNIPETITNLQKLGVIDLHSNNLTGSVNKVFQLGSLTHVDLSDNDFSTGHEDMGFGSEVEIQMLNLSHNSLRGGLPPSIGKIGSLKTLDFSNNQLGSGLPNSLGNASSLEILKLQKNNLNGRIPSNYVNLRKLEELDLSDNLLEGKIPTGEPFSTFPLSSYSRNKGLCGKPLPPCKY